MNPITRSLLLAAVVLSCGRSVPVEDVLNEAQREDPLVEVRVGAIGHCTRSRSGRVECEGSGVDSLVRFTLVERGARSLSVGGGFGYCGTWLTACALMAEDRITCGLGGTHVCHVGRSDRQVVNAQAIAVGSFQACVLESGGAVRCGDELLGDLRPISGMEDSVAVSCGDSTCCAVDASGAVSCRDIGTLLARPHPLPSPAVAVSVGSARACALDGAGVARCWSLRGEEPPGVPLTAGLAVSAGSTSVCVLDARGVVHCGSRSEQPFDVPMVQMEAGAREVCGLDAHAQLHCAPLPTE